MLFCFMCEKVLRFWNFGVNLSNLRSFFCEWTVPILAPMFRYISNDLSSVGVWGNYIQLPLLSDCLVALLLQHTLHASIGFTSCNLSNPSVLVAGKFCNCSEVLQNIGTHTDQKQRLKHNGVYFITLAFNPTCPLSTPTRSHTHKSICFIVAIFPLRCCQHSQNLQK